MVTSSAGLPIKVGSVGKVLDGMQVRLVDETATTCCAATPARSG